MDGRFLKAFSLLPTQRAVCGYPSKPICLRHRVALHSINSPFVTGEPPSPMDILLAAKILSSHDLDFMLDFIPTKEDIAEVRKMVDDADYYCKQAEAVSNLIAEQSNWPVFWSKKNGARDRGVPWVLSLVCNLTKNNIPLEQAWTMPEAQAVWMHAAFSVNAGAEVDIVSDEDRAAMEHLKSLEEELKRNPPQPPPNMRRATNN